MTAGCVLFYRYIRIVYGIIIDNYILAPFFLLFYEMWGFPNKWCDKIPGICIMDDSTFYFIYLHDMF